MKACKNLKIMYQYECNFHLNPKITEEENVIFLVLKKQFSQKLKFAHILSSAKM